jgi:enediyne polyketide synthase
VTSAHARDWTIAASGPGTIACDLEPVTGRADGLWQDLLGADRWELARLIARETGEPVDQAATRAWVAGECLTKAGVAATAPMVLRDSPDGRAVLLGSGPFTIATVLLPDRRQREPMVLGLLARSDDARL